MPLECHKALGFHWDSHRDNLHISTATFSNYPTCTKRQLALDIVDVLGWYVPSTITMKILLQELWETHIEWDEVVPDYIQHAWNTWKNQMHLLKEHAIPIYYFIKN